MMKPKLRFWAVLVLALVVGLGCSQTSTPVSAPSGGQSSDGLGLGSGLGDLKSYRSNLLLLLEGNNSTGEATSAVFQLLEEKSVEQDAYHLLTKLEEMRVPPGSLELYKLQEAVYLVSTEFSGGSGCLKLSGAKTAAQQIGEMGPTAAFEDIRLSELLGSDETINGILTDHYKVGGAGFKLGAVDQMNAEVWVAKQGHYIVRFTGKATGTLDLQGGPGQGSLTWEYNLSDVNATQVSLPAECGQDALADVPLPEGASDLSQMGAGLTFSVPRAPQEIAEFFRGALPDSGWTIERESSDGNAYTFDLVKGERRIGLFVTLNDGKSQVLVIVK
ncbi:MAG: hypothetical protein JW987_16350 [Anaerolineaceae bacterium]|nr:hypothetical protein [Anaerolineaceae bacterium]